MASRISRRIVMQTRPFSQTISRPRFARPDHISGIQKDISGIQKDISGIQKDIHDLKAELKTEIKESKAELKTEIKEFKAEFKAELKDFKAELNGRYGRTENQNFAILVTLFLVVS
jgi:peptidoglycan hydrolase CwlO-like protein